MAITRSDFVAASQLSVIMSRDFGTKKPIPAIVAVFKNSLRLTALTPLWCYGAVHSTIAHLSCTVNNIFRSDICDNGTGVEMHGIIRDAVYSGSSYPFKILAGDEWRNDARKHLEVGAA